MHNKKIFNQLEEALYTELYRRYASALFAYAYQQISAREDAEDIVVEVFLAVLQNTLFTAFDKKKQETWLWTITRNKIVDYQRRRIRRPQVSIDWLSETLYEDQELSPEQISMRREEYTQLYRAVSRLPELQQEVLRLRFGHGLKFDEIAPILEKSEPALRMLLTRTVRQLRSLYKDWGKGGRR